MANPSCFAFELTNTSSELSTLCEQLEGIGKTLKLSRRSIFEINLAMDEIFTNIISYGYTDQAEHRVQVCVSAVGDRLTVVVEDDGVPFNPAERLTSKVPDNVESCKIGGLGIHLVRNLVDDISYRRHDGKNILTLRKTVETT
jgi:anti-sigma regulatory factor (Ser/Thr protein kinase)